MIPTHRITTHPGEMLLEEFLKPLGITQVDFADAIGVSRVRLNEIVRAKRGVTADTALRLAKALGTSPEFWVNCQAMYDLTSAMQSTKVVKSLKGVRVIRRVGTRAAKTARRRR